MDKKNIHLREKSKSTNIPSIYLQERNQGD